MKKRYFPLVIISALILICISLIMINQQADMAKILFTDTENGVQLRANYDTTIDSYYLILPSFAEQSTLRISLPWYLNMYFQVGDVRYHDITQIPMNEVGFLSISLPLDICPRYYNFQLMQCSTYQTVFIEAQEGVIEYVNADKTRKSGVSVTFTDQDGVVQHQGYCDISSRGNGTFSYDKKSYTLSFPESVSVGAFHDIDSLCLLAEYTDDSKLRNSLGYFLGQKLSFDYSSAYQYIDVFINGKYQGLYGVASKDAFRKHIGDGSFSAVFELTSSTNGQLFTTSAGTDIRVYYGSETLISEKLEMFETALAHQDWRTVFQLIDINSWTKKWVMEEFLGNRDFTYASQYFYIGSDERIHYMLPWDFEWIIEARFPPLSPKDEPTLSTYWFPGNWQETLIECPQYRKQLNLALQENITPALLEELSVHMNRCTQEMQDSWYCDIILWKPWILSGVSDSSSAVQLSNCISEFLDFLTNERTYLSDILNNWDNYHLVSFSLLNIEPKFAKRHLFLPTGSDFTKFHQPILNCVAPPKTDSHLMACLRIPVFRWKIFL